MKEIIGLQDIINQENEYWSKIFKNEIEREILQPTQYFSSYWWEIYYSEIINYIHNETRFDETWSVLEAGSGSGKSSILLGNSVKRTFLDISDKALEFASYLAKKFNVDNIEYIQGNIFSMPFQNEAYDLVWNIGVIEHYQPREVIVMLGEMMRVTKSGGIVAFGVPIFFSGPTLKAWLLKKKIFRWIPGYKLSSERFYSQEDLLNFVEEAAKNKNREVLNVKIKHLGNPLPMETPKFILTNLGRFLDKTLPKNKFLKLIHIDLK